MSGHTPGPWRAEDRYAGTRRYRIEIVHRFPDGRGIKPIAILPTGFTCQEADARLIEHAPDMRDFIAGLAAALPGIVRYHRDHGRDAHADEMDRYAAHAVALLARIDGEGVAP